MSASRLIEIPWDDEPKPRKIQYSDPPEHKPMGRIKFEAPGGIHVTTLYAARRRRIVLAGRVDPSLIGAWWSREIELGYFLLELGIPLEVVVDSLRQERLSRGLSVHDKKKP